MTTMNQHKNRMGRPVARPQRIRRAQIVPPDQVVRQAWQVTGQSLRTAMDQHRSTQNS